MASGSITNQSTPHQTANPTRPNQQTLPTRKSPRRQPPSRASSDPKGAPKGQLEQFLWNIISAGQPEQISRAAFRQLVIEQTEAVGACHVIRDNEGDWDVKPSDATGRLPRRNDFGEELESVCESAFSRRSPQIHRPKGIEDMQAILIPIANFGARPEVLLALSPNTADMGQTLSKLTRIGNGMQIWLKSNQSHKSDWKLGSLATLVELVSNIEDTTHKTAAAEVIANDLARHLGCKAAVGIFDRGKQRLAAVSGVTKINRATRQAWAFQQVANEAQLRQNEGVIPVDDDSDDMLLLAHKQLASRLQVESVRSKILETSNGKVIGSLVLAGEIALIKTERMKKFLDASAPRIASAVSVVQRGERSWLARRIAQIPNWIRKTKTIIGLTSALTLLLLMCCKFTYRVRCDCVIQPTDRRFAVAPFDGLVQQTHVKPGDHVQAGQVLASMDGRSIRWELSGIAAEREQSRKTHEMELANRNVSEAMLAQLDDQRLAARQNVLSFQESNLDIRSPVAGIVLSGSPEKNNASSVTTGDTLFEVASIDTLNLEICIPANNIAHVEQGMEMKIWIDGYEDKPLTGKVNRIYPRSEIRNSENVFVAEFMIDNSERIFRPGMKGLARIDSHPRPLAWNLFHRHYEYVVAHWLN